MTTCLTLEPLTFGVADPMPTWCQSFATSGGKTRVRVKYPASLDANSIQGGVNALDALIDSTPGTIVVFSHSQGSQVVSAWLEQHAGDADARTPAELSFVMTGNPQRKLGRQPDRRSPTGVLLPATRDDTQYTVKDIVRRYDGWANWDNWPAGPTPWSWIRLSIGTMIDHCDYKNVGVDDPANLVRAVVGNTTYLVAPT